MPLYGQSLVVDYFAYDTTNGTPKTGDASNHTVYIRKDGGSLQTYSGTITEVDATNAPGLYSITLSASDMQASKVTVYVKSSTSGVLVHPIPVFTEGGRLDTTVGSRLASSAYTPPPSTASIAQAVREYSSRTLTNFGSLVSDIAQAVWSHVIEAGYSALKVLRLIAAVELGNRTKSGNTITHKGLDGSTNRVVGTVDANENRNITTLNGD